MSSILDRLRQAKLKKQNSQEEYIVQTIEAPSVLNTSTKTRCVGIQEALGVFGYTSFRDGQEEVIQAVMSGNDGVVAVFPTGAGKSLIYQIPPMVTGELTIVVSPLISLMRDQVIQLQKLGINAVFINSQVPIKDVEMALREVQSGGIKSLYVAPERFQNADFMRAMINVDVGLFAVDEAHCVSKYGHDFRPSYAELGNVIEVLKPKQVVALTATATDYVRNDICSILGIPKAKHFIRGMHRKNLKYLIFEGLGKRKLTEISCLVKDLVSKGNNTGIIYSPTRKEAENICDFLQRNGTKCDFYHAGLKDSERTKVQDEWGINGGIIVATCAFGMGINRPDVRFVIYSGLSGSIEDIVQGFGRAGRDGKDSYCVSFWDSAADYKTQMFLIDITNPNGRDVDKFWQWLNSEAQLLRQEGSSTVEIHMTQAVMSSHSKCLNVGGCIAILKNESLIKTLGRGKYEVVVDRPRNVTESELRVLEAARKGKIDRLNEVCNFYRSRECRAKLICEYFGDLTFSGRCGKCDNCNR